MASALAGLRLLVTRPAAQAGPFIALAEAAGAHCISLPALEIEPLPLTEPQRAAILGSRWDWAIYTSANAVNAAMEQLPDLLSGRVAAVGSATARALVSCGIHVAAVPVDRADSEGLLQLPDFHAVRGQRILIIKGVGGRDRLRAGLANRGAKVQTAELYRRRQATPAPATLRDLHDTLATNSRLAVVVTSAEILDALLQVVPPADAAALRAAPLFVPGARVAAAAIRSGWTGRVVPAATAEDHAMFDAVLAAEGRSASA